MSFTLKLRSNVCELDVSRFGEIRLRKGTYKDVRNLLFNNWAGAAQHADCDIILNDRIKINVMNFTAEYISKEPPPDWWNDFQIYNERLNSLKIYW